MVDHNGLMHVRPADHPDAVFRVLSAGPDVVDFGRGHARSDAGRGLMALPYCLVADRAAAARRYSR